MIDRAAIKRAALMRAADLLVTAAERCYGIATADERRRRAAAERIAADGEAALAEFINGYPMLVWAEEEAVVSGCALPPRLVTERAMYDRLRREAGDAVARSDPAAARRAVSDALRRAAGGP
jgi:hypothetical protein